MSRMGQPSIAMLVALMSLASAGQAPAQEPNQVHTMGSARRALRPDRAVVRIGIEAHAPTAAKASSQLAGLVAAVEKALAIFPAPLDSVRTVAVSVGPNYDYGDGRKLIDYEASTVIQVSIRSLDALGKLVDAVLSAGATDIPNVTFTSDSSEAARRDLLALAVANARADAEALAAASGQSLGDLIQVSTRSPQGYEGGEIMYGFSGFEDAGVRGNGFVAASGPREVPTAVHVYATWRLAPRQ